MKISNKDNILEKLTLLYLLLVIFSYGHFNSGLIFNIGMLILFFMLLLLSSDFRKSIKKNFKANILIILLLFILFINVLYTEKIEYLTANSIMLFRAIIVGYIISNIYYEDNNVFANFINSKFLIINIFWIINLIVLFFQIKGTGLLIKNEWFLINPMYEDHCSGLFGFSGTHYLAFFSIFILIYNFYYASINNEIHKKTCIYIYNIITTIIMLIMSTMNDNNSIFVLYGIFSLYYFFRKNLLNKKNFNMLFKMIFIVFLFIIFIAALKSIPSISNYLDYKFFNAIESIINFDGSSSGSSERLAIFINALKNHNGFLLGLGFGSWTLVEKAHLGFKHFGISSIGTITTLCGVWVYCILLFLYSSLTKGKEYSNNIIKLLNLIIFIILSIYTIVFTDYLILIILFFTFCVLDLIGKKEI